MRRVLLGTHFLRE